MSNGWHISPYGLLVQGKFQKTVVFVVVYFATRSSWLGLFGHRDHKITRRKEISALDAAS